MKLKKVLKKSAAVLTAFACAIGIFCSGKTYGRNSVTVSDLSLTVSAATTYNVTFPVNNGCKIAFYQEYDPKYKNHDGVDIHSSGNDTIYAAKAGKVVGTGNSCPHENLGTAHTKEKYGESGNYIKIQGNDGIYYWYYHLKQNTLLVSNGDTVVAGQAIAMMGSSGVSTGKHLHFRMTTGSGYYSNAIIANPVGKYNGQVNYSNGPYNTTVSEVIVRFHRNTSSSDTTAVSEKFKAGVSNQKFGYNTNGTGKYSTMNPPDVGFGQWTNSGHKLLGWSKDKNATTASWSTYSSVVDSWIKSNSPYIDLYAVWDSVTLSSISVATAPMTLVYEDGSTFNPAEMVIKATYSDGSSKNVTGYKTSYDFSSEGDTKVTISYTENGVTKSTTQQVSVQDIFSGSGTDADPYKINHVGDLLVLMDQVNNIRANGCYGEASYIQTADIVVDEMPEPIGSFYENSSSTTNTNYAAFNGHYNGNYHKLTNFILNNTTRNYGGVFGRTNSKAVIENLSVSGSVNCVGYSVGGIVGEQGYGSIVRNCDFSGTVKGKSMVGGISGKVQGGGTISSCYANADVTATNETGAAGGIVGYVRVGNNANSADMLCESSYFAGTVTGVSTGGVCGAIDIQTTKECTVTFSKAYYLNTAAGGAVNGAGMTGCAGVYASTLKNMASGLSDVFVNSTEAVNDGYPVFVWQTPAPFAGSGTEEDPYQISSKKDLENMRDLVNNTMTNAVYGCAYYIQTADIDVGEMLEPIGSFYENSTSTTITNNAAFNGHYNGNYHKLTNCILNNTTRNYGGLFGRTNSKAVIENLSVSGSVNCVGYSVGGIVGEQGYGSIVRNCDFSGTVKGGTWVGGISGKIEGGGTISSCYANADVTATGDTGAAGGIVGYVRVGNNANSADMLCENSYFAGTVSGSQTGGVCGGTEIQTKKACTVTFSDTYYLNTAATGAVNSASYSGCLALSESQLKLAAESLGSAYVNNTSAALNDGYPVFEWQVAELRGDVNLDGTVDVTDMVILQQYLTRMIFVNDDEYIVDVTGDGIVNVFDYIAVKRILL